MSKAAVLNFIEKQVIFAQGDIDRNLYKIMSGEVAFYLNYGEADERLVGVSAAPGYFGTMNALSGQSCTYTAVALTKTLLLQLPDSQLDTFVKSDPYNAITVMKTMAQRLATKKEELNMLLGELKELCRPGRLNRDTFTSLVDRYEASIEPYLILDKFEPYTPPAAQESAQQGEFGLFLPGHKGYPGVTHPEYKKYLIQVECTCPHCLGKFKTDKVLESKLVPVRSNAEEMRYDLRVSYRDFEAEWYDIVTCPNCYFSSFHSYFKDNKSLYKSRYKAKLAEFCDKVVLDFTTERDLDFVFAQHYLALICSPGFTDYRQINARIWMSLIRLYKDAGDDELADAAEKRAMSAYDTVYRECELQPGQEQRLCLTVAGMLYAKGEKNAAREWATKVRMGSDDRSAYWNLAKSLIQDVRAELEMENE